jgi:hypothetical protein
VERARLLGVTVGQLGEALAHVAFYAGRGLAIQPNLDADGVFAELDSSRIKHE